MVRACTVAARTALLAGLFVARTAAAQCGANRSSCSGCHDGGRASLPGHQAWHEDHAFADICPTCHGGRGDVDDVAAAHVGLVEPLANSEERCGTCHAADAPALVARYRGPSRSDAGTGAVGEARPSDSSTRPAATLPAPAQNPHGEPGPNVVMTAVVIAVGVLGVFLVAQTERARSRRAARPARGPVSPA